MSDVDAPRTEEVPQARSFDFQPPAGGDLVLKSCDGTTFQAHSVILGMASTVFSDMLSAATKSDAVELAEDAETISIMLAFIYPIPPPQVTTVELLEKVMVCAQKYHIEKILKFIEERVYLGSDLLSLDPMRIFYTSVKHSFRTTQIIAAKSIRPDHCDFSSVEGLLQLAKYFPEAAPAIGLAGAQGARAKILNRVLMEAPRESGIYPKRSQPAPAKTSYPSSTFTKAAFLPMCSGHTPRDGAIELVGKPVHQCDAMFRVTSLTGMRRGDLELCNACVTSAFEDYPRFERWAEDVKCIIEEELEALVVLYSL
ncbi:unnamed protein product [Rhizoctonia solani]|uniref:BTB domain-containing protein n=1 Tax=Rhizoctonia solani TaxID=456999 RepID=A0A8H3DG90_9AGAM|nr:unnamed protein product [Rhizoctonia solani]